MIERKKEMKNRWIGRKKKTVDRYIEKRKISYFGLARNLIQHWISPNQDDLSYSARTFISGLQNGWAAKPTLFGLRRRPE